MVLQHIWTSVEHLENLIGHAFKYSYYHFINVTYTTEFTMLSVIELDFIYERNEEPTSPMIPFSLCKWTVIPGGM